MREPRPITHIEISEKNKKLRMALVIVLLAVGVVAIVAGFMSLLNKETGWQSVNANSQERNCSQNFSFMYCFSGTGAETTAINRQLESAYSEACVQGYRLFTPDEEIPGVKNIHYLNRHVNEQVQVDPVLYRAFEKLEGSRWLYYGPAYAHYNTIFYSAAEETVPDLDPVTDPESAAFLQAVAGFASDPEQIRLQLLGENTVCLEVSEAYLAYAQQEGIENFIDFGYLTNAFVIDHLADSIAALGLTEGYISSADGFTRNLDSGNTYSLSLFNKEGNTIYPAGVLQYRGPASIVYGKTYPVNKADPYYRISGDHIVHPFIDPADGIYRTTANNLVCYSYESGCADVLLRMLPSFLGAGELTVPEGVQSVWFEGRTLCYNDPAATISNLLNEEGIQYTAQLRE